VASALKLAKVPAARGARWAAQGWQVFGRKPLAFTGLFAFFLFLALAALLVPFVGPLLMLALLPLLTLGFMLATRQALDGSFPALGVFVQPFTATEPRRRRALLQLGLAYAVAGLAVMWLSDVVDAGRFAELQSLLGSDSAADRERIEQLLDDTRLSWGLFTRLGLTSLVSVPFWHAPALVHWAGQGAGQALFSSTLAVWTNRAAFFVYVLAWTALVLGFGAVVGALTAITGARTLLALLMLPAGLTFSAAFYASLYFTYADSFVTRDDD
jgi:hypothetical protein